MTMDMDIFEQYINTIEATPQWRWEEQNGFEPYGTIWIARVHSHIGVSAMVSETPQGYRASLCIECPLPHLPHLPHGSAASGSSGSMTLETALAHESSSFLTATEAMLWVEQSAWDTLSSILGSYIRPAGGPRIAVQRHDGSYHEIICEEEVTIGRGQANDIVIEHPLVSRRHARIERREDGFVLIDQHSTNGTYINGNLVTGHCLLKDQDQIVIADTVITFVQG